MTVEMQNIEAAGSGAFTAVRLVVAWFGRRGSAFAEVKHLSLRCWRVASARTQVMQVELVSLGTFGNGLGALSLRNVTGIYMQCQDHLWGGDALSM